MFRRIFVPMFFLNKLCVKIYLQSHILCSSEIIIPYLTPKHAVIYPCGLYCSYKKHVVCYILGSDDHQVSLFVMTCVCATSQTNFDNY